ncbi:hypothetical protein BGZ61DRAFT_542618 [Ilyonectria robusta]|uniref:uncharacterized protein n=1 Tax=Ilyonectria robusta TaxID=1079257 RepID=UPI001E8CD72A|nr:uncharacterized protein BGZ61DRAFT_542618 [Ilyonectria robusta]KAH8646434.1 hypothetical protein BGZ61DRAFT_542618 [Ilyonectria robusta]
MTNTRFQEWYSSYGTLFQNISSNVCNETLQGYLAASNGDTCDLHIDCMLENTRESVKSAIASAAIFLSLVPTVMSMLGPSLVHLAILSTRRPILSFLLSVGSSEFYLDGLFRIESTEELLSTTKGERLFPRIRGPRAVLISAGEYVLACLAVANVVHNSYRLGSKTIVSFVCNTWFFPLVWTLMLPGIFLLVAIPFQFSAVAKAIRQRSYRRQEPPKAAILAASSLEPPAPPKSGAPHTDSFKVAKNVVALEGLPSLGHPSIPSQDLPNFEKWLTILLNVASFVAAIHVLVGICFFSSMLFISVVDAIEVTLRYLVSAAVCRLVVTLEFTGMKAMADHDQGDEFGSARREQSRP